MSEPAAGLRALARAKFWPSNFSRSVPFRTFLRKLEAKTAPRQLDADWLAKMIMGQMKTSMEGHYQQILNGPFDADKLDYIFRQTVTTAGYRSCSTWTGCT